MTVRSTEHISPARPPAQLTSHCSKEAPAQAAFSIAELNSCCLIQLQILKSGVQAVYSHPCKEPPTPHITNRHTLQTLTFQAKQTGIRPITHTSTFYPQSAIPYPASNAIKNTCPPPLMYMYRALIYRAYYPTVQHHSALSWRFPRGCDFLIIVMRSALRRIDSPGPALDWLIRGERIGR